MKFLLAFSEEPSRWRNLTNKMSGEILRWALIGSTVAVITFRLTTHESLKGKIYYK